MNENGGSNAMEEKLLFRWDRWGKYLRILLYLHIVSILNIILTLIPGSDTIISIISAVLTLGFGYCLLRLASAEKGYRQAGILRLVVLLCSLGQWLSIVPRALSLVSSLCVLIACYYEFHAHSAVAAAFDQSLSKKWNNLFIYQITVSVLAGVIATVAVMLFAALEVAVSDVVTVISLLLAGVTIGLEIFYLIYMKQTIALLQS